MTQHPARLCNGGPNGDAWCGLPASHVARDEHGLEWFCCAAHTEGAGQRTHTRLVPVADWFRQLDGAAPSFRVTFNSEGCLVLTATTPITVKDLHGRTLQVGEFADELTVESGDAAAASYVLRWAENMRNELAKTPRDDRGKASAFSNVGRAEAAGMNLEDAALLLEEVGAALKRGAHHE